MRSLRYTLLVLVGFSLYTSYSFAADGNQDAVKDDNIPHSFWPSIGFFIANHGSAVAQNNIGLMYEKGQNVRQDYSKAIEYYTKAANQGNASA